MISCYDLNDNLITIFDSYKECAEWFNTTANVIRSYISRSKNGIRDKKRNKQDKKWYRLYRIEGEDNE